MDGRRREGGRETETACTCDEPALLMDDGIVVRNLLSGPVESTRIAAMQIVV